MRTHRGGGEESALCRQVTTRCVVQRVGQEAVRGELGVDQPLGAAVAKEMRVSSNNLSKGSD